MNITRAIALGLVTLCTAATIGACTPIYTPPVEWAYDNPKTESDFTPDQLACVTQEDPAHLSELDNDGDYQVTGLFVDTARTSAVVACMEARGWDLEGPGWYHGPVR